MKHQSLLIFILFMSSQQCLAQKGLVKGTLYDAARQKTVAGATITLLQQKDSSLVSFSMTGNNGQFELTGLANGAYRLLVTHTSYHTINKYFTISDTAKQLTLNPVLLSDKATTLQEVVVNNESPPVTLVGDTIQYNAGSFKVKPNANVEDLLKKLPGVKVDKDGNVKAQGEKVQKVLVDGKEFFGNDPKLATKNLPADAVDKVQVFDKMSDQAQLTGFDDGNSEKTINLKLKKDKKKGLFGKLTGGAGTGSRYEARGNVNSFKGARQMSVLGMANNANAEGFSFMDVLNFTGALNQMKGLGNGGEVNINISQDDPLAGLIGGNNSGINTTLGTGFNYNNIIGTKTDFRSNYFFSRYNPYRESHLQRQYFTPSNLYLQNVQSNNVNLNHRVNMIADIQPDSFNSIKINTAFSQQQTTSTSESGYSTQSSAGKLINEGYSNNSTNNSGYNLDAGILYRKKFHRRGRTFSANLQGSLNNSSGNGQLTSTTGFYNVDGSLQDRDSINQKNNNNADLQGYNIRLAYTEPLFKRSLLEISLVTANNRNTAGKATFDFNNGIGKFDLPNEALTNNYTSNYYTTNGGLRFRKQTKKYSYSAGFSLQQAWLDGNSTNNSNHFPAIKKQFSNVLPNARFQYQFNRYKNISIRYNSNTNQPSITQLQPVPDNSNPLYVKVGNPALDQEYSHVIRLNASLVNPFKNRNFFAYVNFQTTQNKIVNSNNISSLGVDSVMLVNTNGVSNISSSVSYSFPVRFLNASLEISSTSSYNKTRQFLQGKPNEIRQFVLGPAARLDMNPTEKLTIGVSAAINIYNTSYSLQTVADNHYLNQEYGADINLELPKGLFFTSDFNYRVTNQQAAGYNQRIPFWNMSISKQVLHFNRGELKLSVYDLLNKNVSISRNANLNYIEDNRTNNLRRYFMLSFTYNLSKTGLDNNKQGGIRIIRK